MLSPSKSLPIVIVGTLITGRSSNFFSKYDSLEKKLAERPAIKVPTITIGSDFDGANIDGKAYANKFTGKYEHRILKGIGHNVPQEDQKHLLRR